MKLLKLDDVEIEFEQQGPGVSCKWCVYVRVRKGKHEKALLGIMTDNMPYTKFTYTTKIRSLNLTWLNKVYVNRNSY